MADLKYAEKKELEAALSMGSGYVLNFTDATFAEFFFDSVEIEIGNQKYRNDGASKANRMRAFWKTEDNYIVGKLLTAIVDNWRVVKCVGDPDAPPEECVKIARRLMESAPVPELDAIQAIPGEKSSDELAKSVRQHIERNEPEKGLDRLHTYLTMYFRTKCQELEISVDEKKPLHNLVGGYVKALENKGLIESDMTKRILKSSISVMTAFNDVRNNQSYAHGNQLLNYNESMLIFGHVTNLIKFIDKLNSGGSVEKEAASEPDDEIPF